MCRLALRRLALSAYLVPSRCHDFGEASEPPLSLVGQAANYPIDDAARSTRPDT
jgi:hypothetical protein